MAASGTRRRTAPQVAVTLWCCFCGAPLRRAPADALRGCARCGARFRLEQDAEGCVVALRVSACGAPGCCQAASP